MLSNRLSESIRVSENKLSKKEKKRLAKAALEEAEVESCAQSDVNLDEKFNKYLNIVNKKLRTLRKRMSKIEKYEACDKKELNADQISTIKKKQEVSALIKEFEDLHKQYTLFDEREQKEQETNKKLQEERLIKEVKEKVEQEKKLYSSQLQYLFKANYALNAVINTRKFTFSNAEINALNYIRSVLLGSNDMMNGNGKEFEGEIVLRKLYEESIDECCDGVTYKDVHNLINLIINPPEVSKKEDCQTLSFFSQDSTMDCNEQPQSHQQLVFNTDKEEGMQPEDINEISISISKINFMQPNECIEAEAEAETEVVQTEKTVVKEENQELNTEVAIKEVPSTEVSVSNEESTPTELATKETQVILSEEKKSNEKSQQNSGYQNNQFQKKRGYYKSGRGRRGYQNGQYNSRHGNGNGYKGSRNHGYYPQQNQNYASYYYNNRSATF